MSFNIHTYFKKKIITIFIVCPLHMLLRIKEI